MGLRKNVFVAITGFALLCLTEVSLTGCISCITAREVTNDPKAPGLRYFLPSPYLIIRHLPNDTWDAELQVFVDRSHTFSVQPNAYFAKSNFTLINNADGTIKSFSLEQDSTFVASASITAAKDIALKEMELRQQMLERQIQAAHKSSSGAPGAGFGAAGGGAPQPNEPEDATRQLIVDQDKRQVFVYQIVSGGLEQAGPVAEVLASIVVNQYAPMPRTIEGITWFQPINVRLIDKEFRITLSETWADEDKKFFLFFTDDEGTTPLDATVTDALRKKFTFKTGVLSAKLRDLKDAKVRSVRFNKTR